MTNVVFRAAEHWIGRRARPSAEALAQVAGRAPATVVTGASRGIGLALARRFAAAGDAVVLVARTPETLASASASFGDAGLPMPPVVALDVTAPDAWQRLETELAGVGLYIDRFVNNAGIGLAGRFEDSDAHDLDAMLAVNVAAVARLTRCAVRAMLPRGRGGILNVASLGGFAPGPHQAAYYASKAFVLSLTEAVAHEVRGRGVRVSVVAPGPVETGFHAAMGAEQAWYRTLVPSTSPETVAASAYRGFMLGRRVIVPGVAAKSLAVALSVLPHAVTVPLVARLLELRRLDRAR